MTMLLQNLRYAIRVLLKSPGFTLVAVLTLALGIGANTAMFSVVDAVMLRSLPFPSPEQLMWGWGNFPLNNSAAVSPPDFVDYRARAQSFQQLAAMAILDSDSNLAGGDRPEQVRSNLVSWNFFDALGIQPMLGRSFRPSDEQLAEPQSIILGHGIWKRDFGGDPTVIGRSFALNGKSVTVIGVLPVDLPSLSEAEVWIPAPMLANGMKVRRAHFLTLMARLKPGVSAPAAQGELDSIAQGLSRQYPDTNEKWSVRLEPLLAVVVGPGLRTALLMLLAAVGALLLISCGNVAILLMARATSRRREYAIRAGLGAGRWSIASLMLTESLVLSLAGGALGTLLSVWGVSALKYFAPATLPRLDEIQMNPAVLLFALGVSVATALIFGLAPALLFSHAKFNELLKEGSRGSVQIERHRASTVMVIGEMAMSLCLLAGAGLLLRSLWTLTSVNPGFRADHVITATLTLNRPAYADPATASNFLGRLEERLAALPGVQSAGAVSELPLSGQMNDNFFRIEGRNYQPNQNDDADFRRATPGYLSAMGIPLLRGRWINWQDSAASPAVVVVNQPFVEAYFPNQDPLGRRITIQGDPAGTRSIVGVIGGVNHFGLNSPRPPEMYLPVSQMAAGSVNIVVRAESNPKSLALALNDVVSSLDSNEVLSAVRPLDDVVSKSVGQPRFSAQLLGLFAILALTLAGIGLYGMIAFSVSQRTNEIGIRMALGARPGDVMRMILGRGLRLALAGTLLGLIAAAGVAWLLRGMLFGIAAADPVTFIAVAVLLIVVALAAAYFPARRAMRVDPMVALRYE